MSEDAQAAEAAKRLREAELAESNLWTQRIRNLAAAEKREPLSAKLESNLKKTQGLIRKLKTLADFPKEPLIAEICKLNLSRYVSEVAAALAEAKLSRVSDVNCAVEIASIMHQRYAGFSALLESALSKMLGKADRIVVDADADKTLPAKFRSLLRFYTYLFLSGVFQKPDLIMEVLKKLIKSGEAEDRGNVCLSIVISFLKYAAKDFTGILPSRVEKDMKITGQRRVDRPSILSDNLKKDMRKILIKYWENLCKRLEGVFKKSKQQMNANKKTEFYKGVVGEKAVEKLQELMDEFGRLNEQIFSLSDLLGVKSPELVFEDDYELEDAGAEVKSLGFEAGSGFFDDEQDHIFYEIYPDLSLILPAVLLSKSVQKPAQDEEAEEHPENDRILTLNDGEESFVNLDETESFLDENQYFEKDIHPKENEQPSAFSMFLQALPAMNNKDEVDKLAEQYCYFDNKGSRRKVIQILFYEARDRTDVLPFYARFVKILSKSFPEIGADLLKLLVGQLYGLLRSKTQHKLEAKVRCARYLSELIKFRIGHHSTAFNCWNFCLGDFNAHSIHVMFALLEGCGRWLYKNPETHERCKSTLEKMLRMKQAKYLEDHLKNMVDNAFLVCVPSERASIQRSNRTMLHEYIRKLIYDDLKHSSIEEVVKQLLRLSWDSVCLEYVRMTILDLTNIRAAHFGLIAKLLSKLQLYHPIHLYLIDDLLEEIRFGMELNVFQDVQSRLSYVRLFGEFYNHSLIDSSTVFYVLYQLISFGHEISKTGVLESRLDPPKDAFRIRLICALLETCGINLDFGKEKVMLDHFLIYFQRYILLKEIIPVDVEFILDDLFDALCPKMQRFKTLEEVQEQILRIEKKLANSSDESFTENDTNASRAGQVDVSSEAEDADDIMEEEEEYEEEEEIDDEDDERWDSRDIVKDVKPSEDDIEFKTMFEKALTESVEERQFEPRAIRNLADADTLALHASGLPSRHPNAHSQRSYPKNNSLHSNSRDNCVVQFLTRKNKGVLSRPLEVPSSEKIIVKPIDPFKAQEEHEILKKAVIQGIERDEATQADDLINMGFQSSNNDQLNRREQASSFRNSPSRRGNIRVDWTKKFKKRLGDDLSSVNN